MRGSCVAPQQLHHIQTQVEGREGYSLGPRCIPGRSKVHPREAHCARWPGRPSPITVACTPGFSFLGHRLFPLGCVSGLWREGRAPGPGAVPETTTRPRRTSPSYALTLFTGLLPLRLDLQWGWGGGGVRSRRWVRERELSLCPSPALPVPTLPSRKQELCLEFSSPPATCQGPL